MKPEPLSLEELLELEELNELDVLYKLIEVVSARDFSKRIEQVLGGNKQAGVDVRRNLQDIKLLSNVIRDKIQERKDGPKSKENNLDKAISNEKKRIAAAEEKERIALAKAAAAIAAREA